jgi:cytochrome c biogenesis protein CcmG, thiol:disulfide interchange protein DsbE
VAGPSRRLGKALSVELAKRLRFRHTHGMILRIIVLASLLSLGGWLRAADVYLPTLKIGSEVYTNVTVTSVTATDIYFFHSRGMGNAKLKNLEPGMQKKFHFDPAKAAAKETQQAAASALYASTLREAKPIRSPKATAETGRAPREEPAGAAVELVPYRISARSFLNKPTPSIEVEKWLTERPDFSGKFILVDFWATWCGPCRQSIEGLNVLHRKFGDRLVVIGLSDEPEKTVRRMTNPTIDYYVGIDSQRRSLSMVGVRSIPHALLIDPKGIVRFEGHPGNLDEQKLQSLMAKYSE